MKRLHDNLQNKHGNYMLPFFWQHGEDEETLRLYMEKIYESNIRAVCVECRPHPDFCGEQWWHDFDIIMDEARKRGMKVWLLDDAHFPTGYANGAFLDADPSICKQYINFNTADVVGPLPECRVDIESLSHTAPSMPNPMAAYMGGTPRTFDDDELISVVAYKVVEYNVLDECIDLTAHVKDGELTWDVPNGMWRIFVTFKTRNGGGRADYMNIIDRASVRVLLDKVYEPHYARYKDDFGKTFVGFFSDEPLLGNTIGFDMDESIGKRLMPLPWCAEAQNLLSERNPDWAQTLPFLWADAADASRTAKARYDYMDVVTRLVEKNFSRQLGEWCSEHGVEYIGHIIEDNNQHSRLGSSVGHYFRGLAGQHMAGIDDIGGQVLVGGENHGRKGFFGKPGDGEFYHFALAKLGASDAHISPLKQGRAMCEIFGAYGWNFGVRKMKYVADHFLVRGINHFVPHAFTPKAFPDPDCPPHFYAHGHNPQFRHFGKLMSYMQRSCHLLNGGTHIAPAAVLYHGEAEWTGGCQFLQKAARVLTENQIDFDIVPSDLFTDMQAYKASFDGELKVNGESFKTLIIPYAEFITASVAQFCADASKRGFAVLFIDALPSGICGMEQAEAQPYIDALSCCDVVSLPELANVLRGKGIADVSINPAFKRLRVYHYRTDSDVYMLTNEDPGVPFVGTVTLPSGGACVGYDALDNVLRPIDAVPTGSGAEVSVTLEPYQSLFVVFGAASDEATAPPLAEGKRTPVLLTALGLCEAVDYPNFADAQSIERDFSGFIRYDGGVTLDRFNRASLEIADAYEGVELWVNDEYAGMCICPPYRFDISKLAKPGDNTVRIEVANTLANKVRKLQEGQRIMTSFPAPPTHEPSGIVGAVEVVTE